MGSSSKSADKTVKSPLRVAIIGTVGVPACYGGFETLTEQLLLNSGRRDVEYTVYCSSPSYPSRLEECHGARLRYIPLKANGMQSIPYDILSMIAASGKCDVMLILGVSGCVFLPVYRIFSRKKLIINIDGLEHRRDKWRPWVRRFLKYSEACAVRHGDVIIADNRGIADYVNEEYGKEAVMIPYGGDQTIKPVVKSKEKEILRKYGLRPDEYDFALCRIEPENNVEMILEAFEATPERRLLFVGNWNNSQYGRDLRDRFASNANIDMADAVYNLDTVNTLRSNCCIYLHGHSAGGTNPSLVEAMFFHKPIMAFDVVYNRHTTEDSAIFFDSAQSLASLLHDLHADRLNDCADRMAEIAERRYRWQTIASEYEALY